jgi:queuine tRNA-ribosyltransferase
MSSSQRLSCNVIATDPWSSARATVITTRHGEVQTPIFMPVATQGALRCVDLPVADDLEFQVLLANTYHLLLRPGPDILREVGGLHSFMNWNRGILTDSGGFQIFSLSKQLQMSEEGATFRSYVDGKRVQLSPERSIEMQKTIGSDIMMVLDQCIRSTSSESEVRAALELTTRWAKRSYDARGESDQALFGIVQGACYPHLRRESAEQITAIDFDGFALGGLAVGETKQEREDTTEYSAPLLPADKPRYLMGVGTPIDLLEAVRRGMDMFDCILPTSLANQGVVFTSRGRLDLRRGIYRLDQGALDPECSCSTCRRYTRAYLQHLVRAREFVAGQLLSVHNLTFYRNLMRSMREAIIEGSFRAFYEENVTSLESDDLDNPPKPPPSNTKVDKTVLGNYQVVVKDGGIGAIQHRKSGEVMHISSDPREESYRLYVEAPRIQERLSTGVDPLVVWDVGLGAATNAMVCLLDVEKQDRLERPLEIVSFENDLDSLRLALRHPWHFAHLRHGAPHKLLSDGVWKHTSLPITWRLLHGDFMEYAESAPKPDVVWFDPFSTKVNEEMWEMAVFERVFQACKERATSLHTFSSSTAVRAALLKVGWWVGTGPGTGQKRESTRAYTPRYVEAGTARELLDSTWLQRWERSHAQVPTGVDSEEFKRAIRGHPQFAGL